VARGDGSGQTCSSRGFRANRYFSLSGRRRSLPRGTRRRERRSLTVRQLELLRRGVEAQLRWHSFTAGSGVDRPASGSKRPSSVMMTRKHPKVPDSAPDGIMTAIRLLLLIAVRLFLFGATPSLADSFAPRSFGYPSYAGAPFQAPVFGSSDYGNRQNPRGVAATPSKGCLTVARDHPLWNERLLITGPAPWALAWVARSADRNSDWQRGTPLSIPDLPAAMGPSRAEAEPRHA
jgi:hypothetical protein